MKEIYQNQSGIISIENFDYLKIGIIGFGSIGSFVALGLNKLGFKHLYLYDDDKVEQHNTSTQLFTLNQVNNYKVNSGGKFFNGGNGTITSNIMKVTPHTVIDHDIVFVCVDSLKQRKIIASAIVNSIARSGRPKLIIDGRMHRLVFKVFTIPTEDTDLLKGYVKSTMGEEFEGACTEKGIIQNVFAVTAVMIEQLKKTINGEDFSPEINCDFERYTFLSNDVFDFTKYKDKEKEKVDV